MASQHDGSWRGRCPVHDGQSRDSLSLRHIEPRAGDRCGRAQLRCFAGCDERDVLDRIGLGLADLYDTTPPSTGRAGTVTREHAYLDGADRLIGVVRRTEPKSFRPATPTSDGWVARSSDQLKQTPYRLLEVVKAIADGSPVYVVEGERDADALAAAGLVATCNAGGAGKWTAEHAHWLRGADVVVWRDRDDPGHRHADQVITSLQGIASSVRLVEAVDGKDAADHLAAGHTIDDVVEVPTDLTTGTHSGSTPGGRRLKPTLASAVRVTRQRWLWSLRIVLGGLTLLAGREGLGKSTIAVDVVADVTTGLLDGEYKGEPRSVIYIHTEDARDTTLVPRLLAAGADLDRVLFVDAVTTDEDGEFESQIVLPTDVAELAQLVIDNDVALVVLDAATSVIDGRLDGDKDRQMRRGLEGIARGIGERTGCAVLGIVHFGKRDSGDTGKLILGSIAWSQVARSVLAVARDDDTGNLVISTTKANLAPGDAASLEARLVNATVPTDDGPTNVGRVDWLGETSRNARDLLAGPEDTTDRTERAEAEAWLEDYLTAEGKTSSAQVKDAAKKARIAERTLHRARQSLGVIVANEGFPRQSHWSLPDSDASPATDMPRARDGGTTGTTGPDLRVSDGTTGTTEPVVPPHVHGTTGGATAPVHHITDRWRVSGEPA
jgi:hypothetical protein